MQKAIAANGSKRGRCLSIPNMSESVTGEVAPEGRHDARHILERGAEKRQQRSDLASAFLANTYESDLDGWKLDAHLGGWFVEEQLEERSFIQRSEEMEARAWLAGIGR